MAKYGVWMLERLVLQYSEAGGSSRGMRAFVQQAAPQLRASNPQLQVEVSAVKGRGALGTHPSLTAYWRNGRQKTVCVKNLQPDAIAEHIYWLRNSHGRDENTRVVASRHLSRQPSIQGMWTVNTFSQQLQRVNAARQAQAAAQAQQAGFPAP